MAPPPATEFRDYGQAPAGPITLDSESYGIGATEADIDRRRHFSQRAADAALTSAELQILADLGIGPERAEMELRPYMADFFDALPHCQSDTALALSKQCEVPYFVLWSTLFSNQRSQYRRIVSNKAAYKPISDITTAAHGQMLADLRIPSDVYTQLFTIMLYGEKETTTTAPEEPTGITKPEGLTGIIKPARSDSTRRIDSRSDEYKKALIAMFSFP